MKAKSIVVTMILAAGLAMGQTGTTKKPAAPASQSSTTKPATTTMTPAKPATTTAAKPAGKTPAKASAKSDTATVAKTTSGAGKRDPFLSPIIGHGPEGEGAPCATGKRCLVIDQLKLQGVVKTTNGWIAVIANPAQKVYYLRVNDALFDGYVSRIEGDSVIFRQNVLDALGKQTQREVVKRVIPSA
jgi:hypothetical protein